jgi:hypothetical protein
MGETITIRTGAATEVIKVIEQGPQGPVGPKGDPGDVAGLPLTTTGDTLYRSNSTTNARLPIGTNGQVLKVANGIPAWGNESGAVTSVNGETGAVTIPAFSFGFGGSGLVPQASGAQAGRYLRGDGTWSDLPAFEGSSSGLVPASSPSDSAKYLKGNGTWSDEPVTPTEVEADYFDRGGDNAATRSGTGGQKRYQIVLSNDTRLTDARQMLWASPPPTSPTNSTSGRALGSMSYDGSYLYILVQEVGGQSVRWARAPMAVNW